MSLIEIEPGRFVVDRRRGPVARSRLPAPMLITDEMPPTEQIDGKFYTSKRTFRAVGRAHGLTEVGNEVLKPKTRSSSAPQERARRREAIKTAVERYRAK